MKKEQITTLKKIAKCKAIEILNKKALVYDGRIFASDIETTVSFRTNISGKGVIEIEAIEKPYDSAEIRDGFLFVTRGKSVSKTSVWKIDDYPETYEIGNSLGVFDDVEAVHEIAHFAANDPMRPIMSGIHIDETNLVCTDAHRLGWRRNTGTTVSGITINANALNLLSSGYYQVYEAQDHPDYVIFASDSETFWFKLYEGKYPNYEAVIPKDNPLEITVNTKDLLSAISAAEPSANKTTKHVIFTIFENTLTVSAEDIERGTEFLIDIPISMNMDIEEFRIGFNCKLLTSVISTDKKETKMTLKSSNRPFIVNENNLLMPVMIEDPETYGENNKKYILYEVKAKQAKTVHETPAPIAQKSLPVHVETQAITEAIEEAIPVDEISAEIIQPDEAKPFVLVLDYSEKAIVVIGETKPFRETFKEHHGTWNPWVKIDDVKVGGWIFSKKRRAEVEEIINA